MEGGRKIRKEGGRVEGGRKSGRREEEWKGGNVNPK